MEKAALILEGGALRVLFTSGILDFFLESGLEFEYVNGVSGGALCGVNYLSKQVGRTAETNIRFLRDKRYIGVRNLLFHDGIFNFEFLFGDISEHYLPFDYETYRNSPQTFEAVATNCLNGQGEFFKRTSDNDQFEAIKASASMPLLSKTRYINDTPYLDGGIAVPIPYQRAFELGYEKAVVVLTQDQSYRKPENDPRMNSIVARRYQQYPEFVEAFISRPQRYNQTLDEINQLESEGKLLVIRPKEPVKVSRMERDPNKLKALYKHGIEVVADKMPEVSDYLALR